jgi:hypothetical protein
LVEGLSESPPLPTPLQLAIDLLKGEPEDADEPSDPWETTLDDLAAPVVPHQRLL